MVMMIAPSSLVRQKEGAQEDEEKEKEVRDRRKEGQTGTHWRGRSHRSILVRGVRCEEQKKAWTVVWVSTTQEGQRGLGISLILSR